MGQRPVLVRNAPIRTRRISWFASALWLILAAVLPVHAQQLPEGFSKVGVGNAPSRVAIALNDSEIYVLNSGDGTVSVVRVRDGKVSKPISVGDGPSAIAFSLDGRKAYVAFYGREQRGGVAVIDTRTKDVLTTVTTRCPVADIAIVSDSKALVALVYCGLGELDLKSNEISVAHPQRCPMAIALSPDRKTALRRHAQEARIPFPPGMERTEVES